MKEIEIKENGYTYEMREELKTLRTNIQFCGDDKRVILLTSSVASAMTSIGSGEFLSRRRGPGLRPCA